MLNSLDSFTCPTDFTYGRDGKPCFIPSSEDDDRRIDRVLAILERSCGPEGFDYDDGDDDEDEGESDREAFQIYCETLPNDLGGFYFISGFVTAALLAPDAIPMPEVIKTLSEMLGLEPQEVPEFASHMFPYWNGVAEMILECLDPSTRESSRCVDIWVDDLPPDSETAILVVSILWARGWKAAIDEWREHFLEFPDQPKLKSAWESIEFWASHEQNKDTFARYMDEVEAGKRPNMADAVKQLAIAMRGKDMP